MSTSLVDYDDDSPLDTTLNFCGSQEGSLEQHKEKENGERNDLFRLHGDLEARTPCEAQASTLLSIPTSTLHVSGMVVVHTEVDSAFDGELQKGPLLGSTTPEDKTAEPLSDTFFEPLRDAVEDNIRVRIQHQRAENVVAAKQIAKLLRLQVQGCTINRYLEESRQFRNPYCIEKIMETCSVSPYSSNFPVELYDPAAIELWEAARFQRLSQRREMQLEHVAEQEKQTPDTPMPFEEKRGSSQKRISSPESTSAREPAKEQSGRSVSKQQFHVCNVQPSDSGSERAPAPPVAPRVSRKRTTRWE